MKYEFYAIYPKTKQRAIVQVKTDGSEIFLDDYRGFKKVFLFQTSGICSRHTDDHVIILQPDIIEKFIYECKEKDILPRHITH